MATLVTTLEALLRVLHPIMPFITEEIWQRAAPVAGIEGTSICDRRWPENEADRDESAEEQMQWIQRFILGVRQIRGEMDIAPGKPLPVIIAGANDTDRAWLDAHTNVLARMGNIASIEVLDGSDEVPASATALLGDMTINVPMAGLIDVDKERERLEKQIRKSESDLAKTKGKLGNANFVDRAPPEVVATERERLAEHEQQLAQLKRQLSALDAV